MTDTTSRREAGGLASRAGSVAIERDVMVPMRDGVLLASDVYRPAVAGTAAGGAFPVLLLRTPYDKAQVAELHGWPRLFARHGYVAVVQDCRGCFNSQGEVGFLWPEADDGYDTVAWIRRQPWCDGVVGTWGCSWESWTQTALAAAGAEGVAAMIPTQSGANAHASSVRHGGAMELRMIAWAYWHSACNAQAALKRDPGLDAALGAAARFSDWLSRWPIRPGATQLALVPPYERWAFELLTHGDYDERWRHPSVNPLAHLDAFTDAPTLLVGGWYDSYTRATFELFEALSSSKRGPIKVLIGPWAHGEDAIEQPFAGDVWFGHDATLDFASRFTPYYLHGDAALRPEPPSVREASTTFAFDPSKPVPTIGGNVSSLADLAPLPAHAEHPSVSDFSTRLSEITAGGGFDQREAPGVFGCAPPFLPLASRPDVLVFQTPPLEEDVEVTGPIAVHLWVASSAVDTDVTAKLLDVYPASAANPEGYALNLTDSILRLRYRDDPGAPAWLTPGQAVRATITLYPTSNVFCAGHRIRLDVSSSNFPRFDVNPNTGEPLGAERRTAVAQNTIFHDATRPSHVVLPIVPAA